MSPQFRGICYLIMQAGLLQKGAAIDGRKCGISKINTLILPKYTDSRMTEEGNLVKWDYHDIPLACSPWKDLNSTFAGKESWDPGQVNMSIWASISLLEKEISLPSSTTS